jgi:hypothetical protein
MVRFNGVYWSVQSDILGPEGSGLASDFFMLLGYYYDELAREKPKT